MGTLAAGLGYLSLKNQPFATREQTVAKHTPSTRITEQTVAQPTPSPRITEQAVATAPRATPVIRNHYVPADQLPGYHGEGAANRSVPAVTQEVPAPRATLVQDPANFVMSVLRNYNNHDYLALAPYLVSGHLN